MTGWCNTAHHEDMLWRSWLILFGPCLRNFIPNGIKIDRHIWIDIKFRCISRNTGSIFIFNNIKGFFNALFEHSIFLVISDHQGLSNLKFNFCNWNIYLRVVDSDISMGCFICVKYVFIKTGLESSNSMINAATCLDWDRWFEVLIRRECNWWLMNDHNLLVLKHLLFVSFQFSFNGILHNCLWSCC